jgi:acetolactate synthase-1/2/3 large subunit
MKYDNELRTGKNVKQMVHRAMQFAMSDPKGPVYLMGAREVMEEEVSPAPPLDPAAWPAIGPAALRNADADEIAGMLAAGTRPLVVTSYLGRNPAAVGELVRLCERLGVGVLESVPSAMNFPHAHPLYLGNQWNEPKQHPALAEADVVLVVDSDVPWIPTVNRPREEARIIHLDVDPLKERMPLWYIGAERVFRADAATALRQLNDALDRRPFTESQAAERRRHYGALHHARARALEFAEARPAGPITAEYLTACIRRHVDEDTIVLNEGITNYPVIFNHLAINRPGAIFASGGGSLGWNGGAALGVKMALPHKTVFALGGDGSYMFSAPSSVHWMAMRYGAPFLQVVYNNRGWRAPKFSALQVHPSGHASRANDIGVAFDPPPDYAGIAAAAGGAFARKVERVEEVEPALAEAVRAVREEGRAAVLDVWLEHL